MQNFFSAFDAVSLVSRGSLMPMIRIFSEKHMQQYGLTSDELDRLNAEWQEKAKLQGLEEHMPEYWQQARLHAESVFAGRLGQGPANLSGAPPVDEPVDLPSLDVDIHDLTGADAGAELVAIDLGDIEEAPAEPDVFPDLTISLEESGVGQEATVALEEMPTEMEQEAHPLPESPVVQQEAEQEIASGKQEEMAAADETDRAVSADQPVVEGEEPAARGIQEAATQPETLPPMAAALIEPVPAEQGEPEETAPRAEPDKEAPPAGQPVAETTTGDREEEATPPSFWRRLLAAVREMFKGS